MKNAFELAREQTLKDMEGFFDRMDHIAEQRAKEKLSGAVSCVGCEGKPAPGNNPCGVCGETVKEPSVDYSEGYEDGLSSAREIIESLRSKIERLEAQIHDLRKEGKK